MQTSLARSCAGRPVQTARPRALPCRGLPALVSRPVAVSVRAVAAGAAPPTPPPAPKPLPPDTTTRQYRRTVYDFALWAKHRSINRYLYNLATLPGSRIIRTLMQPISVLLALSVAVGAYETGIESGTLPSTLPTFTFATMEPLTLTSFALSLLLVFRTNSSYGRFDEARKIWGGILNRARSIGNQAVTFIPAEDVAGREAIAKWTVGFCRALQAHLQEDADLRAELQKAVPKWTEEEIEMLVTAQHRPIKAISVLSELTRQLNINSFHALQMQENCVFFYDALGGCERLLRTPLPLSYTRHTARFLTLWLSFLPFALWVKYHWMMIPIIFSIALLLLGIDEIGVQIEEPFGILPLDAICTRAQTDVNSLNKDDGNVSDYVKRQTGGKAVGRVAPHDLGDVPLVPLQASTSAAAPAAAVAAVEASTASPAVASSSNGNGNGAAAKDLSMADSRAVFDDMTAEERFQSVFAAGRQKLSSGEEVNVWPVSRGSWRGRGSSAMGEDN